LHEICIPPEEIEEQTGKVKEWDTSDPTFPGNYASVTSELTFPK
jgi:hypothetical protein